jgi:hypothetical protein
VNWAPRSTDPGVAGSCNGFRLKQKQRCSGCFCFFNCSVSVCPAGFPVYFSVYTDPVTSLDGDYDESRTTMKLLTSVVLIALGSLQTGCINLAEIEAAGRRAQEQHVAYQLQQGRTYCEGYGYQAGSNEFAQCVQAEVTRSRDLEARQQAESARQRARELENRERDAQRCPDNDNNCDNCLKEKR